MNGYVHSFQSMGALDGPGLRYVVFMQGCPLRCVYCHNPDTWDTSSGIEYTAREIVKRAARFKPYFGEGGGVTVSGGEPLFQDRFVAELFGLLHEIGINTALDTSGAVSGEYIKDVLKNTDLVICDIKFPTEGLYKKYCGASLNKTTQFLKLTEDMGVPLWVRHVVVPNLTDTEECIKQIAGIAKNFSNLKKTELLAFKKLCVPKYEKLNIPFPLENTPECGDETLEKLYKILEGL